MEAMYSEPRLLVIDDDPAIVTFVSTALNEIGWHVSTCTDPAKVCDQVANEPPNAVLLDIHLQFPASGWRVLQALREQESTREVPVVVFSGQIRELEEREAWLLEQQIAVLSKPFELEDLYDAVQEYHPGNAKVSREVTSASSASACSMDTAQGSQIARFDNLRSS